MNWQIRTLNEAHSQGVPLLDGHRHAVYQQILNLSTAKNARNHHLFSYRHQYTDLHKIGPEELQKIIKTLVSDNLIYPMMCLYYRKETGVMDLIPYCIAMPESSVGAIAVQEIYKILVEQSTAAVIEMVESRQWIDHESLWRDLELETKVPPEKRIYSDATIFPLKNLLNASGLLVSPSKEFVAEFKVDLLEALEKGEILGQLEGYGYTVTHKDVLQERYEITLKFLKSMVLPKLKKEPALERALKSIVFEEALYWEENDERKRTVRFDKSRAKLVLSTNKYGGHLASAIIRDSCIAMQKMYDSEYRDFTHTVYKAAKTTASSKSAPFVIEKPNKTIPAESLALVRDDTSLVSYEIQTPEGEREAFILKSTAQFQTILGQMYAGQPAKYDVLTLKGLIETAELAGLVIFTSNEQKKLYGRMLARLYEDYVPWLYRIFIFLRLPFFQDKAYTMAKARIQGEQSMLSIKNQKQKKSDEQKNGERFTELQNLKKKNIITDVLDEFYLAEDINVPTVSNIFERISYYSAEELRKCFVTERFIIIPAGTSENESLIFYAVESDWRSKAFSVIAKLNPILKKVKHKMPLPDHLTELQLKRIGLLYRYLRDQVKKISGKEMSGSELKDKVAKIKTAIK